MPQGAGARRERVPIGQQCVAQQLPMFGLDGPAVGGRSRLEGADDLFVHVADCQLRHGNAFCGRSYYYHLMNAISVKLPSELHATLFREARRRNVARSTLVREIIENALGGSRAATSPSCAELAADLIGSVRSGRADLATNPRLLDDAVVQDARRATANRRG